MNVFQLIEEDGKPSLLSFSCKRGRGEGREEKERWREGREEGKKDSNEGNTKMLRRRRRRRRGGRGVEWEIERKGARQRHNSHIISIKNKELVRREKWDVHYLICHPLCLNTPFSYSTLFPIPIAFFTLFYV